MSSWAFQAQIIDYQQKCACIQPKCQFGRANCCHPPCAVQKRVPNCLWKITLSSGDRSRLKSHFPSVCVCLHTCVSVCHPESDLHHFSIAPAVSQASHPLSLWLLKEALGTLCADTPVPKTAGWSPAASQPKCFSFSHHLSLLLIWLHFRISILSFFSCIRSRLGMHKKVQSMKTDWCLSCWFICNNADKLRGMTV